MHRDRARHQEGWSVCIVQGEDHVLLGPRSYFYREGRDSGVGFSVAFFVVRQGPVGIRLVDGESAVGNIHRQSQVFQSGEGDRVRIRHYAHPLARRPYFTPDGHRQVQSREVQPYPAVADEADHVLQPNAQQVGRDQVVAQYGAVFVADVQRLGCFFLDGKTAAQVEQPEHMQCAIPGRQNLLSSSPVHIQVDRFQSQFVRTAVIDHAVIGGFLINNDG